MCIKHAKIHARMRTHILRRIRRNRSHGYETPCMSSRRAPGLHSSSVVRLTATAAAHLLTATGRAIQPSDGQVGGVACLSALSVARFLAAYRDDSAEACRISNDRASRLATAAVSSSRYGAPLPLYRLTGARYLAPSAESVQVSIHCSSNVRRGGGNISSRR